MKNKRKFSNILISLLATLAVYIGAVAIYLYSYGWRIDLFKQTIVKTGIVSVESDPFLSDLYINGENKGRTPKSLALPVGTYTIKVSKEGYIDWIQDIKVIEEKSTPIYPWLFKKNPQKENIYSNNTNKYIKHWNTDENIFILTSSDKYNYHILKYAIDTAFWDLSSNPKEILSIESEKELSIDMNISPDSNTSILSITSDKETTKYIMDNNKVSSLDDLEEIDLSYFNSYKMSWSNNSTYIIFESDNELVSYNIDKKTKYLLLKEEKGLWYTDDKGFLYTLEDNTSNTNKGIYSYQLVQQEIDGSNPKVILNDLYFQKDSKYINEYRENKKDDLSTPFTNAPECTKSVGKITSFIVYQDGKGVYINTDQASYWYDMNSSKYILISPYTTTFIDFSKDNMKFTFKDEKGYSIFTYAKTEGDHTSNIGSKYLKSVSGEATNLKWLSKSKLLSFNLNNYIYIVDIDDFNLSKIIDNPENTVLSSFTEGQDRIVAISLQDKYITIDKYIVH